mmetsp:Transcript_108010/g.315815  ORF Transcript_108010/g.315815 Transcript_108010/m.315815 type:complete len:272 (-) Transcript_108010:178-993(-)
MSTEYDPENIFAKIIDGKVPCFKVFESKASLAFLDAFPMVEGHTLLVPKLKGYKEFIDMPPAKASEFLRDLQKVASAIKEATGATGVNIWQNGGEDAGQAVFHPHFHIVPRTKDDGLHKYPPSAKEMMSAEKADPMVEKIVKALDPPKPLKKATFGKVSSINPDSKGLNLNMKVLEEPKEVESKGGKFFEALCGDASGTVVLSLRENQKADIGDGSVVIVRNAAVKMVQGHIRLAVDKWGKVEKSEEPIEEDVDKEASKNISSTEYELVPH